MYKLFALAYMPPQHVVRFYSDLVLDYMNVRLTRMRIGGRTRWVWVVLHRYMDWKNSWDKSWIRKRYKTPTCSIESWNQYDSILSGGVSTTNSVKSFNRTWNMLVGSNPNIWKGVNYFKNRSQNSVGHDLTSNSGRKERSASSRQRINLIVEQFNTHPNLEYLLQIAHELQRADK